MSYVMFISSGSGKKKRHGCSTLSNVGNIQVLPYVQPWRFRSDMTRLGNINTYFSDDGTKLARIDHVLACR